MLIPIKSTSTFVPIHKEDKTPAADLQRVMAVSNNIILLEAEEDDEYY